MHLNQILGPHQPKQTSFSPWLELAQGSGERDETMECGRAGGKTWPQYSPRQGNAQWSVGRTCLCCRKSSRCRWCYDSRAVCWFFTARMLGIGLGRQRLMRQKPLCYYEMACSGSGSTALEKVELCSLLEGHREACSPDRDTTGAWVQTAAWPITGRWSHHPYSSLSFAVVARTPKLGGATCIYSLARTPLPLQSRWRRTRVHAPEPIGGF